MQFDWDAYESKDGSGLGAYYVRSEEVMDENKTDYCVVGVRYDGNADDGLFFMVDEAMFFSDQYYDSIDGYISSNEEAAEAFAWCSEDDISWHEGRFQTLDAAKDCVIEYVYG